MTTDKKKVDIGRHIEQRFGPQTIGDIIKTERLCWNMKQKDFAQKLGITQKELSAIERGALLPSYDFITKSAKKLRDHPARLQRILKKQIEREKPNKKINCQLTAAQILQIISQQESS